MNKNFPLQIIKNSNKELSLRKDCSYLILKKKKKKGKSMLEDMKLRFMVTSMV